MPDTILTPSSTATVTGIKDYEAILYGKPIPVFVGGQALIGGRIIEGPFFSESGEPTVSYIASHGVAANPSGTREILELRLDGKQFWTPDSTTLATAPRFQTGTEDQMPDAMSIARFGDYAVPYRGHILSIVENLPLIEFNGYVPFPSVMVADSSLGDPLDGITRTEALEILAAYAGYAEDEIEIDVSGMDQAWIVPEKKTFIELLQDFRVIFPNWNIVATDKLRIFERGELDFDLIMNRDDVVAHTVQLTRLEPPSVPRKRSLTYIDIGRDYEINTADYKMEVEPVPTTSSLESDQIELPITMTNGAAMTATAFSLFSNERNRRQMSWTGMPSNAGLQLASAVKFTDPGTGRSDITFTGRVYEIVRDATDFTTQVKAADVLNCIFPANIRAVKYTQNLLPFLRREAALAGVSDSKQLTVSFWLRNIPKHSPSFEVDGVHLGGNWNHVIYENTHESAAGGPTFTNSCSYISNHWPRPGSGTPNGIIDYDMTSGDETSTTESYSVYNFGTPSTDSIWVNFLMSVDLSGSNPVRHYYVNGVQPASLPLPGTLSLQGTGTRSWNIDFTTPSDWTIGGAVYQYDDVDYYGQPAFLGEMAEFWFAPGQYIDFSVQANREKFRLANGLAAELGSDGSTPTGTPPAIYFSGNRNDFGVNRGTGGDFIQYGTFLNPSSDPFGNGQ